VISVAYMLLNSVYFIETGDFLNRKGNNQKDSIMSVLG